MSLGVKLPSLNDALKLLGHLPISKKKTDPKSVYLKNKVKRINKGIKEVLNMDTSCCEESDFFLETMQQIKNEYAKESTTKSRRLLLLTGLPKSMSVQKIMKFTGASKYMAVYSKKLQEQGGIFSMPKPAKGYL